MSAGVFQYSFAQAKTRAMKGRLLDPEEWYYLLRLKNLEEVSRYLNGTPYAEFLPKIAASGRNAASMVRALYEGLFRDYAGLLKAVPAGGAKVLKGLLLRYEAENLKTILRGIYRAGSASKIRSLLYSLEGLSNLPVDELLELRQVAAAVALLKPTIFHSPVSSAMPRFISQGRLFPIEIAIDMAAFASLADSVKTSGFLAGREAEVLAGRLIDRVNLSWVVRFRHFFGLSPEETINYTLPGGYSLSIRDLGNIARATDLPSFVNALPDLYREALKDAGDWQDIAVLFERWLIGEFHRTFRKHPFQVGLQVSYLLLKEIEVKGLESLISAIGLGVSREKFLRLVSLPVIGGVRV